MSSPAELIDFSESVTVAKDKTTSLVRRWQDGIYGPALDYIAEEVPLALMYNGIPYAVMLTTPNDIKDFVTGFSLTEEIILDINEIISLNIHQRENGIEARITIPANRAESLKHRTRNIAGCTGCGLCGTTSLDGAIRQPHSLGKGVTISTSTIHRGLDSIKSLQKLNNITGAVHAAVWLNRFGDPVLIREDVGRHNALDKLIGALKTINTDLDNGFLIVTSRASFEMVQKAALSGISLMVAISAPTALAVKLANDCGLSLVGFARDHSHVLYSHPQRLLDA
jgi:FdhD protein